MLQKTITITADGSATLLDVSTGEHYHSIHGAFTESMHVFIKAGLLEILSGSNTINVLEIGFGTGLNTLLTYIQTKGNTAVHYHGIEAHPVDMKLIRKLKYENIIKEHANREIFQAMHRAPWNQATQIASDFILTKEQIDLLQFEPDVNQYDLVYFDAFSPGTQPELWTAEVFATIFQAMKVGGILTTYSARGSVKEAMRHAGFSLERLPGPAGKRHMLRCRKKGDD